MEKKLFGSVTENSEEVTVRPETAYLQWVFGSEEAAGTALTVRTGLNSWVHLRQLYGSDLSDMQ